MKKTINDHAASLTPEELKERRESVDIVINTHAIDGIELHPKTLEILEGYARGDYSLEEFNVLMENAVL
ncbi:antitoxin VbhA family protein [Bartonella sp. B10]